jgi:hypothetical protein
MLLIPAILGMPGKAAADRTFRCGASLIGIGDEKETVLSKCGEPDEVNRWEEDPNSYISQIYDYELEQYRLPKLIKGPVLMERWTYDLGSNRFVRYLYFQNGKLYKIEAGEKGGH